MAKRIIYPIYGSVYTGSPANSSAGAGANKAKRPKNARRKPTEIVSRTPAHYRIKFNHPNEASIGTDITDDSVTTFDQEEFIEDKIKEIRNKHSTEIKKKGEQSSFSEGFVYLLVNEAFPGWVKLGMTIDYELRLQQYQTGDPNRNYKFSTIRYAPNRREAEQYLLAKFSINNRVINEWIKIDIDAAVKLFHEY